MRQLLARQHAPGIEHQFLQQRILPQRKFHRLTAKAHAARRGVELDAVDAQLGRGFAARAPHQRAQARGKLVQIEGFDQVIVGAGVQTFDAVLDAVARGQDQHRHLVAARAQARKQLQAREPRQAEIEHDARVLAGLKREFAGNAVLDPIDDDAGLAESGLYAVAEQRVVLDQKYPHSALIPCISRARRERAGTRPR